MSDQYTSPELLAERLDRALPPGRSSLPPVTTDPLVNTAVEIARLKIPSLSPSASTRIEGRMLAVFNEQHRPQRSGMRSLQAAFGTAGRWALVASVLLVLLTSALTPAVAASVPGEPLYPVKQFYERVELAAATSPSAQATVYLWHAHRRTQEALALLERNQFDAGLIDAALSNVDEASKTPNEVRESAQLRAEVLQVQTLMGFVLNNARQTGLTTEDAILQRVEKVEALGRSELLLPLPAQEHNPNALTETATPTPAQSPTPEALLSSDALDATPTCENGRSCLAPGQATQNSETPDCENGRSCLAPGQATDDPLTPTCENGRSCLSHGTPGATSTPRPTQIPPTRRPTRAASGGGGGSGGNAGDTGNAGGNSGGNDTSGGNSAGGNSGGSDNAGGNAGGGGSDNAGGNAGGNGSGGGGGKP